MGRASVGHKLRGQWHVGLVALFLRHPYDVGGETRITVASEQNLLDFGCPPKTLPSGGRDEHDDANLPDVRVEGAPQRLAVSGDDAIR
jgi:hypothetical protein